MLSVLAAKYSGDFLALFFGLYFAQPSTDVIFDFPWNSQSESSETLVLYEVFTE